MISKFADNIRGGIIDSEDGYKKLLQALDQLDKWVEEWLIQIYARYYILGTQTRSELS